jgi:hypothetical protein
MSSRLMLALVFVFACGGSSGGGSGPDAGISENDGGEQVGPDAAVISAGGAPRGYQPRPCGLDLDRDGTRGEEEDCNVCNGTLEAGLVVQGSNVAGAGQHYVDCASGTDAPNCGSVGNPPCRSIEYAWNSVAGSGFEIICFTGVCTDADWNPNNGGAEATYEVQPTGNQVRSWHYPSQPKMVLGWDRDQDGEFPPFDTDDESHLDGSGDANRFMTSTPAYVELAHFSASHYNDNQGTNPSDGGLVGRFWGYDYIHDIELDQISNNSCQSSSTNLFPLFGGNPVYVAIENLEAVALGGYFSRGGSQMIVQEHGPLRYQNLTVVSRGIEETQECGSGGGRTSWFKIWGGFSGIEVLDSVRDCDIDNWNGLPPQWPCNSVGMAQCSQDWDVVNNEIRNSSGLAYLQGHAQGYCEDTRPVKDVRIDGNFFVNTRGVDPGHQRTSDGLVDDVWEGTSALSVGSFGPTHNDTAQDISITNNVFYWENPAIESGIMYSATHSGSEAVPGYLRIENNTFYGPNSQSSLTYPPPGYVVFTGSGSGTDDVRITNNIFAGGASGCFNISLAQSGNVGLANLVSDYNVFDANCSWTAGGAEVNNLPDWQSHVGGDENSQMCTPVFDDAAALDFHLSESDECALNAGTEGSTSHDFEGDPRGSNGAWDIGADEWSP